MSLGPQLRVWVPRLLPRHLALPVARVLPMGCRDTPHRPILLILLGPLLEPYLGAENVSFALGGHRGDYWLASDLCGLCACWLVFFLAVLIFYRTFPPLVDAWARRRYPNSPTALVSAPLVQNMKDVAEHAFPLYATMPVLTDFFQKKGWAATCDDIADCGGLLPAVLGCVAFFATVEVLIFFDHYYLLHKWDAGKRLGQHAYHHVYKYADQLNAFSGYSFAPQDGWSQGMPLALCTLFVPVPIAFVLSLEVLTGLWTLYIHTDLCPLPWPLMGCDYHYIHHRYNWSAAITPPLSQIRSLSLPVPPRLSPSLSSLPVPLLPLRHPLVATSRPRAPFTLPDPTGTTLAS
jgi:sterol desaturase/sphingolipid hydroxylase (fatty acid hydroxylase superfamily)